MKKKEILSNIYSKYGMRIILAFFMLLFIIATEILSPIILKYLIDVGITSKDVDLVLKFTVIYFFLFILTALFNYLYNFYFSKVNNEVINHLKLKLFDKILHLEKRDYDKYDSGYLLSRLNEDSEKISTLFADTFFEIIRNILYLIGSFSIMVYFNWRLAIIIVIFIPIYFSIAILFSTKIQVQAQASEESKALLFSKLKEFIQKFKLIKLTLTTNLFSGKIKEYQLFYYDKNLQKLKIIYLNQFVTQIVSSMIPLTIIGYGTYETINGNLTIGAIFAFLNYANYTVGPASSLMQANANIQQGIISLNRYLEIYNLPSEINGQNTVSAIKQIKFDNVAFSYLNDQQLLEKMNFEINTGDKVVIMGDSGSGKTTITNMINVLYKPKTGNIFINGKNINNLDLVNIRQKIAFIDQEPVLINDSLIHNITLKNTQEITDNDRKRISEIIHNVHAEFIYNLPNKLSFIVQHNGENLSTGQKQRIALARALFNNPDVLILDEPLTGLDAKSKDYIINFIENFSTNKILIIITHLEELLPYSNKILLVNQGTLKIK